MKDDRLYLRYVLERIERIERYTAGGRAAFLSDEKTQDATLRNLQTIAESTQRISDERKRRFPELDWRGLSAFRNVVVHNYLGIDLAQIWAIVEQDLPLLKQTVLAMLKQQGG